MALFLPCVGMSVVFIVYMCLLFFSAGGGADDLETAMSSPEKPPPPKGLSGEELDKLPKVTGKELVMGNDCAVCLDEIESEQPARMVPGCNHGFHLQCADTWLSKNPVCPVCRARLGSEFLDSSQSPC